MELDINSFNVYEIIIQFKSSGVNHFVTYNSKFKLVQYQSPFSISLKSILNLSQTLLFYVSALVDLFFFHDVYIPSSRIKHKTQFR